jgi:predicted transcriptional regulator
MIMKLVAKDIMNPLVVSVTDTMDLREVAKIFMEEAITGAPVVDEMGHLVGVISQSDLVEYELATEHELTVEEDTPIREVAARMAKFGIHRLIVVDQDQQLHGIVTSIDVLRWVAEEGEG